MRTLAVAVLLVGLWQVLSRVLKDSQRIGREHRYRQAFVERHVLGDVDRQGRLAHGRARRQLATIPIGRFSTPQDLGLVGEKGPEIFTPSAGGTIIPNDRIGGDGGGAMKLTIVNNTSARIGNVVEQRISATERALIIQEAVGATAAQMGDPNSGTSRSLNRNFSVQRSR